MGQIADDMICGMTCSECGMFFKDGKYIGEHGYPVLCWECHEPNSQLPRALYPTFGGEGDDGEHAEHEDEL